MNHRSINELLCLVAALASLGLCAAAEPSSPQVIVLRTGHVMTGEVTETDDSYRVDLPGGGQIMLPRDRVAVVGGSLPDVYQKRLDRSPPQTAGEHLSVAQWCLRNDLLGRAAHHVSAAVKQNPKHPGIRPLQQRLVAATSPRREYTPTAEEAVATVSFEEIESELAELPTASVNAFAISVQPLLINRCGGGACHGGATKSGFRLHRSPWGDTMPRRLTLQNLHATVKLVDRERLDHSKLLTVPLAPHGTTKAAIFTKNDSRQLMQLAGWVQGLAATPSTQPLKLLTPPDEITTSDLTGLPASADQPNTPSTNSSAVAPAVHHEPIGSPSTPSDPFDPAEFHRKSELREP